MPHFLQNVLDALKKYSARALIKILLSESGGKPKWRTVTYGEFLRDIERAAGYWLEQLKGAGFKAKDVVGLWVTGDQYHDLVFIYALSRAGYTPQVLNKWMTTGSSAVAQDVLAATGSKVMIFDPYFKNVVVDMPLTRFELPDLASLPLSTRALPDLPDVHEEDIGAIFHTSGTTSGRPTPVPETHRWLICQAQIGWPHLYQGSAEQAIMNNLGSFSNVGSATAISYLGCNGQCLIQTSRPDFDEVEFMAMVQEGLNFMFLYAPWLSKLISKAKANKEVYGALRNMTQITYTGASLNPKDERWLIENGIPLTVAYATTETAGCFTSLISEMHHLPSMQPFKGVGCILIPIQSPRKEELDGLSEKQARDGKLFSLFIPADSANCPHPSVRNRPDGHFTGDLFEETGPGLYAFRGRKDDWIRTGKYVSFCDTKSIEDNIMREAADLVRNCVVVGHYKPHIVLLVEPATSKRIDEHEVKSEIMRRHTAFNSRLYVHERLRSTLQIVLVPQDTLARTMEKGNIRRKAAEEQHAKLLEEIYAKLETRKS